MSDRPANQISQVHVHWQHPRHELEKPVLLVDPGPSKSSYAAEVIEPTVAAVVCHEELYRDDDGEIQKRAHFVGPDDEIPVYVADALLDYDSNYGPIDEVVNPVDRDKEEPDPDVNRTMDDYVSEET